MDTCMDRFFGIVQLNSLTNSRQCAVSDDWLFSPHMLAAIFQSKLCYVVAITPDRTELHILLNSILLRLPRTYLLSYSSISVQCLMKLLSSLHSPCETIQICHKAWLFSVIVSCRTASHTYQFLCNSLVIIIIINVDVYGGIITHKTLQGHLTNTKQSRVKVHEAQVLASSPKDVLKSTVFSCRRKAASDCSSVTKDDREFQAQAAATGNARSPRVLCHVAGTISVDLAADCRRLQELRLVVRCKVSARYRGAVTWRHRKARTQSWNFILSGTLNQWSSQSNGVMCSDFLVENTSRVAAFNTDCNRLSRVSDTPASTDLQ